MLPLFLSFFIFLWEVGVVLIPLSFVCKAYQGKFETDRSPPSSAETLNT
jgi:hypothetical protein